VCACVPRITSELNDFFFDILHGLSSQVGKSGSRVKVYTVTRAIQRALKMLEWSTITEQKTRIIETVDEQLPVEIDKHGISQDVTAVD